VLASERCEAQGKGFLCDVTNRLPNLLFSKLAFASMRDGISFGGYFEASAFRSDDKEALSGRFRSVRHLFMVQGWGMAVRNFERWKDLIK